MWRLPLAAAALLADEAEPARLDAFNETLHLRSVPFAEPHRFLARFEFSVTAPLTPEFRADQFDLFPKPIGKLLNAHKALTAFEATLTRGRWKDDWGAPPREFRPPGATLIAALATDEAGDADEVAADAWRFLISAVSGSLCASFEGVDPDHEALAWVSPLDVPWAEPGRRLRFATLPYEPVCTENLTPWLKLLPCGHHRGLAALMPPVAIAESPLLSLTLAVAVHKTRAELRASLDVVLPLQSKKGLAAWFDKQASPSNSVKQTIAALGGHATHGGGVLECHAAGSSRVVIAMESPLSKALLESAGPEASVSEAEADVHALSLPFAVFAALEDSAQLLRRADEGRPKPWAAVRMAGDSIDDVQASDGLVVMRDILSREGRSERTHGRYLLKLTNRPGVARRVRFMDQLPFFIKPLWHTLQAHLDFPGQPVEELQGLAAMRRLAVKFASPPDGEEAKPTEVFLTVDVPPGGSVSLFLDVSKRFIPLRSFSYACEKGFDVSSAAWMELELPQSGNTSVVDDFAASLAPLGANGATSRKRWRLRFTEGLIVLLPMPDFSMPFNVIALSSTALTFFFGSIFRLTAAGRVPHWVSKKDGKEASAFKTFLKKGVFLLLVGGLYFLHAEDDPLLAQWRQQLPPAAGPLVDMLVSVKEAVDGAVGR